MKIKNIIVSLLIIVFMFCFDINVKAMEEEDVIINDEILSNYSDKISFLDNDIAFLEGSFGVELYSDDVIESIDIENLFIDYGIKDVYIVDSLGDKLLENVEVISGMGLVFEYIKEETNDEVTDDTNNFVQDEEDNIDDNNDVDDMQQNEEEVSNVGIITYTIMVMGDVNSDSIVDELDVTNMIDMLMNYPSVNIISDINKDGNFDVLDVTGLMCAILNNKWDYDEVLVKNDLLGSITINNSVFVGDEFTLKYTIKGYVDDVINGISGSVNYDKDLITLLGIEIDSKYGYINDNGNFIYVMDELEEQEFVITFRFKADNIGDVKISIDDILLSMDGVKLNLDSNTIYTEVSILDRGTGGDGFLDEEDNNTEDEEIDVEEVEDEEIDNDLSSENNNLTTKEEVTNNKVVASVDNVVNGSSNIVVNYVKVSSDNYIKSLNISGYDIEFNKDILEYSIKVGSDVESLELNIELSDYKAGYEVIGNNNLKSGNNVVSIVVTSEDGSKRTYIINVDKEKNKEVTKDEESSDTSRVVIIILIILVIIGLIYIIFKDDADEEKESNNKEKK